MKRQGKGKKRLRFLLIAALIIAGYAAWALYRPLPAIQPSKTNETINIGSNKGSLIWPAQGQAAASALGSDVIDTHGDQKPVPTASTAKVITALMVLQKKPLALNQAGPMVTITPADVANYNRYVSQDGSVLPVVAGEQLSEYQMLQALMLPSANNIADKLAEWTYGSIPAYAQAANAYLVAHGITNTHVGSDASGLAPDTTSTAEDLVKIGKLAMAEPVLAQIVSQSTATGLPLTSVIRNVNGLLGSHGVVGIKTGNSDQAGGVFIGAAISNYNNKPVTVITAVAAAPDLTTALTTSSSLLRSSGENFTTVSIVKKRQILGSYTTPWGATAQAIVKEPLDVSIWQGETAHSRVELRPVTVAKSGQATGTVTSKATPLSPSQPINIYLDNPIKPPSLLWRLTHPY
jgi:D-alanyl-D-alanine carboxypeptidase (penicillin-binding protein 5/6)